MHLLLVITRVDDIIKLLSVDEWPNYGIVQSSWPICGVPESAVCALYVVLFVDEWPNYGIVQSSWPICGVPESAVCALYVVLRLCVGRSVLPSDGSFHTARPRTDGEDDQRLFVVDSCIRSRPL